MILPGIISTMIALVPLVLIPIAAVAGDQASFASNTANVTGVQDPLHFDAVYVNRGSAMDQDSGRVHIQYFGLFLVTLSAGHQGAGGQTNFSLQRDGSMMTSIFLGAASGAPDNTIGLDIVSFFNQHEELHIRSDSSNLYSTPLGKLTSWGTVSLSQAMGVSVGFGVCRTTSNVSGKISFNVIWTNVGGSWNSTNNMFIAPVSGTYFFSFSNGIPGVTTSNAYLQINGQNVFRTYRSRSQNPTEIFGRSVMTPLLANDQVTVYTNNNGFSDQGCLTSFTGFLYNSWRDEQLAWSVYRASRQYGGSDPLVYEHVLVNEGGVWLNNRATCHITGLYYVHISTGILDGYPAQLTLMKGSDVQGELRRVDAANPSGDTIGRSMIIHCNAGENLRVTVAVGSGLWSTTDGKMIAFIGFYIFP